MRSLERQPESQDHYSYVTRSLLRLYDQGLLPNIANIDVEPEYGYTTRITYSNGEHRITYGNDLGLNTASASHLAKDKGHTKFMLEMIEVNCPGGEEFLLPWWAERIGPSQRQRGNNNMRTIDQAEAYIEAHLGYPIYVKPVAGSQGVDIHKITDPEKLNSVLEEYNKKEVRVAIVEEAINMPDYRVVCLDDELISAYRRNPLGVVGDGVNTIQHLLERKQEDYRAEGRSTILNPEDDKIVRHLAATGRTLETVPGREEEVTLLAVSNLSAGGTSEDVTDKIDQKWIDLVTYVAQNFSLRLCGVDLACEDITDPGAGYSVIEVNASPGLDNYADSGEAQRQTVDELYVRIFNAMPQHV